MLFPIIIIGCIAAVVSLPLIIYHFLMFPNLNGVVQDLDWFNYDADSQHFLYWFGFWFMGSFGGALAFSAVKLGNSKS